MTEQEKFNAEVQIRLAKQDTKFELFMEELKQQREDIRRMNEKHDADIKAIDAKFDSLTKQINDTWKQTMIGVGGMIIALGALLIIALK